ncbi:hypothetical protein MWU49_04145 [Alcanivorax sp. S6407]|uniref:hypothetical protein n=1 Tax=Alcanivorax sp. S6407 TaxID=2926424 RepID=UPI001FF21C1B|nr:hypothetical protein [Alcanivorax sp. S6407]MCK0152882.1 hypothetical protein [Alcanivorax sp. S6407]
MMKWRLILSSTALAVVLCMWYYTFVWQQGQPPEGGVKVVQQRSSDGVDWYITLHDTGQTHWQANGSNFELTIDKLGNDGFAVDLEYQSGQVRRHVQQKLRLEPGLSLIAAFGEDQYSETPNRVLLDRVVGGE